jgi:hypothetical protein
MTAEPPSTTDFDQPGDALLIWCLHNGRVCQGHANRCQQPCQDRSNWGQLKPQIGKRAHQLPPMQQGHICVESDKNVGHLLGGRWAHPQHQDQLKSCQAGPAAL